MKRRSSRSPSIFRLTAMKRSQLSWTRWRLKRVMRRQPKEELRLQLMLHQVDSQHLRLKALQQQEQQLLLQQSERMASLWFRQHPQELPRPPETAEQEVARMIGLPPPRR